MVYLKIFYFWFSLIVFPAIALFGLGYVLGQVTYSNDFSFNDISQTTIIPLCICAAFEFKRTLKKYNLIRVKCTRNIK